MTTTAIRFSNTLMFARHCKLSKEFALTFLICLPHFAVVRTFPAMSLTEHLTRIIRIATLGTVFTTTVYGGTWISLVIFCVRRIIKIFIAFVHWKVSLLSTNITTSRKYIKIKIFRALSQNGDN